MRRLARPLVYLGVLGFVAAFGKYHAAAIGDYDLTESSRLGWSIAYAAFLCVAAYGVGLPDVPRTPRSALASSVAASAVAAGGVSAVQLVAGDALLPRFVVFGTAAALVPWFVACTAIASVGRSAAEDRDRVVLVGDEGQHRELVDELAVGPERPAVVVARLSVAEAAAVDERRRPLVETVVADRATVVVLDAHAQLEEPIVEQAASLHVSGVRVRTVSLFYEEWLGKLPVADLGRVALFFDIGEVHRTRYGRAKRVVDVVAAVVGLVPLLVAIPIVACGDLVANRGPLLYRQERVGRSGRPFRILKFRTMTPDRSDTVNEWTTRDDPRITPFGGLLRRTHLDELPQVWNILRGDLSLVGPRPEQPHYVADLVEKLPYYDLRHTVRPGLTGWAQVKYGYAGDERDALEKLQYEFHYLRRQTLWFDLRIVGRTVRHVLGREGR